LNILLSRRGHRLRISPRWHIRSGSGGWITDRAYCLIYFLDVETTYFLCSLGLLHWSPRRFFGALLFKWNINPTTHSYNVCGSRSFRGGRFGVGTLCQPYRTARQSTWAVGVLARGFIPPHGVWGYATPFNRQYSYFVEQSRFAYFWILIRLADCASRAGE
jgi:hypothetical protein